MVNPGCALLNADVLPGFCWFLEGSISLEKILDLTPDIIITWNTAPMKVTLHRQLCFGQAITPRFGRNHGHGRYILGRQEEAEKLNDY